MPDIYGLPNAAWNRLCARRAERDFSKPANGFAARELWAKTIEEVSKGVCQGPFTYDQLDRRFGAGRWRAMARFAVEQLRADGTVECRPCDDAAASQHNLCTSLGETITCESADFPARAALVFASILGLSGDWAMLGGTDDIELAYRQCPVRTPQFTVVTLSDPTDGIAKFFAGSLSFRA